MNRGVYPAQERRGSPGLAGEVLAMAHRRRAGQWYTQPGRTSGAVALTLNVLGLTPLGVSLEPYVIEQFGLEVTVAATTGTTVALALYLGDEEGRPSELLAPYGTVAVDSTGFKMVLSFIEIPAGIHAFAGFIPSATSGSYRSYEGGSGSGGLLPLVGSSSQLTGPGDQFRLNTATSGQVFPPRLDPTQVGQSGQALRINYKVAA